MNIFSRLCLYKHKKTGKAVMAARINNFADKKCIANYVPNTQPLDFHQIIYSDMLIFSSMGFHIVSETVFLSLYETQTSEKTVENQQ